MDKSIFLAVTVEYVNNCYSNYEVYSLTVKFYTGFAKLFVIRQG